jgi:hypothetical protein
MRITAAAQSAPRTIEPAVAGVIALYAADSLLFPPDDESLFVSVLLSVLLSVFVSLFVSDGLSVFASLFGRESVA